MADPEAMYNWRRLDNRITTSGQPTEEQLADIHTPGLRHDLQICEEGKTGSSTLRSSRPAC
jgi:hypothetical protein